MIYDGDICIYVPDSMQLFIFDVCKCLSQLVIKMSKE